MSKIDLSRFERLLAQRDAFVPDFQVLIAALSAHQETSETARVQTTLARRAGLSMNKSDNMVELFADGADGAAFLVPGSFSAKAATLLTHGE